MIESRRGYVLHLLFLMAYAPSVLFGQQALLQITSPADGTAVAQGQTITISVSADPSVQNVGVIGESPLPNLQPSSSGQFTLTLPTNIPADTYQLTAIGFTSSGDVESNPISIDVEPASSPISIRPDQPLVTLLRPGNQLPIHVIGSLIDSSSLDVTHSSSTIYSSGNTQIATVDSMGMVTAVGPGQTYIMIQWGSGASTRFSAVVIQVSPAPATGTPPTITGVTPNSGVPGVTQVTVTGTGFGATQGSGTLQLGTFESTAIASWSDTQVVATVPANSTTGMVEVDQNGLQSNTVPFTISTPFITSISPVQVLSGMQMTISGGSFGSVQGGNGIVVIGNKQGSVVSWSDTQIIATVAEGTLQGHVTVGQGGFTSNSVTFARIPPQITSISPTSVLPGTQMTIIGTGFDDAQYNGWVVIGNEQASIVSWSDTQIVATVPAGTQGNSVYMQQGGVGSNSVSFTLSSATLVSIAVTPASAAVTGTSTTQQFAAIGTFSDGSNADLTSAASWVSSNTSVATINSQGLATPTGYGSTNITASFGSVNSNTASFTVNFPTL